MVKYRDNYYGLDQSGTALLAVPILSYLAAVAQRKLDISILQGRGDGSPAVDREVSFSGLRLTPVAFKPVAAFGSADDTLRRSHASASVSHGWSFLSSAFAGNGKGAIGGRLFVLALSSGPKVPTTNITPTLAFDGQEITAATLSPDLRTQSKAPLLLQSGVPLALGFEIYFPLSGQVVPDCVPWRWRIFFQAIQRDVRVQVDTQAGRTHGTLWQ